MLERLLGTQNTAVAEWKTDILDVLCGWAEMKGRDSSKHWILVIEEKVSDEIIKVHLTNMCSEHLK